MTREPYTHDPVLPEETVRLLVTDPNGVYVDGTVGLGGHASAVLSVLGPEGRLIGLDWDPEMLAMAEKRLEPHAGRFRLIPSNFRDLEDALRREGVERIAGALFDLGISSYHYDEGSRGFSFQKEGPLDMRLNPENTLTAGRIVNDWPVEQLTHLLREYGEERQAYKIAKAIAERREAGPIRTTRELRELIERRVQAAGRIHPATRTFMALRIAVNRELENLTRGIEAAASRLSRGGRLAVIAFHSLEDRIVKSLFADLAKGGGWKPVTKGPVAPGLEEIQRNPRSRSAKLRVLEKS